MFDIRTVNLDAGSYLSMTPEKELAKSEKEVGLCRGRGPGLERGRKEEKPKAARID